ncbi:DUF533 domain-containing protein [Gemmobacter lanyuensis]
MGQVRARRTSPRPAHARRLRGLRRFWPRAAGFWAGRWRAGLRPRAARAVWACFWTVRFPARPRMRPHPAQELGAALMLRAMIQAIKADGQMDAAEKRRLMETLDGATRQELDFVNAELAAESDIEGLAAQVPVGMEAQVYAISLAAIDLDSRAEADYLAALARALGLTPAEVTEIHDAAGAPRLQV